MKTSIKDYIFSTISISCILAITLFALYLIKGILYKYFGIYYLIVVVFLFFALYGSFTALFLKILSRFFPFKEGVYSMNDAQFTLWKLHAVVGELGKSALSIFFPVFLKPPYYLIFGAKIGKNTAIGGKVVDPYLTILEDFSVLGEGSIITSHAITFDKFILKAVKIQRGATVGVGAIIMPGVTISENSIVAPGSVVPMDIKIPPNELWGGVPAKKIKDLQTSEIRA